MSGSRALERGVHVTSSYPIFNMCPLIFAHLRGDVKSDALKVSFTVSLGSHVEPPKYPLRSAWVRMSNPPLPHDP